MPNNSSVSGTRLAVVIAVIWLLFAAAVFVPDIGRGFVKDDFAWIAAGRMGLADFDTIVRPNAPGFYRPLVGISFAANYWVHGLNARAYGFTNLFLYAACAVFIALLLRQLGVSLAAAALGAFTWAINPHGIGMAVLWISGRTSLLLTLCSTLAAIAFLRRHRIAGALLLFCALLSKEEAVVLPIILLAVIAARRPGAWQQMTADVAAVALPLAAYFALRVRTPAFTPATAPWFYQPTSSLPLLASNILEYLDRGVTIFALMLIIASLAYRAAPRVDSIDRRVLAAAAVWFVGGFALTVFVPVRSSLYAVFPSVGSAIAFALALDTLHRLRPQPAYDYRLAAVVACLLLVTPVYRIRNNPWVEAARVSDRTMRFVISDIEQLPEHGTVLLEDERVPKSNFRSAFGSLATEALQLYTGRPLSASVLAPDDPASAATAAARRDIVARYRLENGRVSRVEQ